MRNWFSLVYQFFLSFFDPASGYWRAETLPFPEPGVGLLPQSKLSGFDDRVGQFRQDMLLDAACVVSSQCDLTETDAW